MTEDKAAKSNYDKYIIFLEKGSELADKKREKNKAMPRAPSIRFSSIDEALSLSSRARCNKGLILFPIQVHN
ncbi:uncharacterized protein [Euphorbia lathyris]|uniref:uncharacterized protein n=1 Tax=Euphorbia lathyris TaxID=212925 RepID=UPI0033136DD4